VKYKNKEEPKVIFISRSEILIACYTMALEILFGKPSKLLILTEQKVADFTRSVLE